MPLRERDEHGYINTDTIVSGWHVVIIPGPDLPTSEQAKRIVRHTFGKKFMAFIGEDVGPTVNDTVAYYSPVCNILYITQAQLDKLEPYIRSGALIRHPKINGPDWLQLAYPATTTKDAPDVFSI